MVGGWVVVEGDGGISSSEIVRKNVVQLEKYFYGRVLIIISNKSQKPDHYKTNVRYSRCVASYTL